MVGLSTHAVCVAQFSSNANDVHVTAELLWRPTQVRAASWGMGKISMRSSRHTTCVSLWKFAVLFSRSFVLVGFGLFIHLSLLAVRSLGELYVDFFLLNFFPANVELSDSVRVLPISISFMWLRFLRTARNWKENKIQVVSHFVEDHRNSFNLKIALILCLLDL